MTTTKCAVCGSNFLSRGMRVCPSCMRSYRALIRKKKCIEYLGGKCAKCGRTDEAVLTFHHIDPAQKSFNISDWIGMSPGFETMTWAELQNEIDKTTCLCFNCHRLEHYHHHELKEYIPYLTKEQRQELESDIIHDSELLTILNDEEAIRDSLMLIEEPTDMALEIQRYQDKIEQILVTTEEKPVVKEYKCLYCGDMFSEGGINNLFCSDYCLEQAKEEAVEVNKLKVLQEIIDTGIQNTCSRHGWKYNRLKRKVPFLNFP